MSIDAVFKDTNIALKTLWEAVLLDQDGGEIAWTKPLITAVSTPRLKLTLNPVDGGANKAYVGYELPDNISLTMYETADRKVEKYLDGWMFGPNGVFNKETGQFRKRDKTKVTNIYRGLKFITTVWTNDTSGKDTGVGLQENNQEIKDVGLELQENNQEIQEIIIKKVEKIAGRILNFKEIEEVGIYTGNILNSPAGMQARILKIQQILPQLTAIAAQAANQVLGIVPGMFMPRVVIPPPLIVVPAVKPKIIAPKISTRTERSAISSKIDEEQISLRKQVSTSKGNSKQSLSEASTSKENSKQALPEGSKIKTYEHKEKRVSVTTYTCAIEGYEPSSYDYESGGAVTYTVNLSTLNYRTAYS